MGAKRSAFAILAVVGVALAAVLGSSLISSAARAPGEAGSVRSFPSEPSLSELQTIAADNYTISQSTNLSSDLFAPSLTIEPGVVLSTNGFSIIIGGTFDNQGTILTGSAPSEELPNSVGGSGGGAQSLNWCPYDENGTSTSVAGGGLSCSNSQSGGAGSSSLAPSLNSSTIAAWYSAGIQNYLAGGSGGAVQGYIAPGPGAWGLYVQAQTLIAGTILAAGGAGEGTCSGVGLSGGGGGGAILLAYSHGVDSTVNINVVGGAGAISCSGTVASGAGGSGQLLSFQYGSVPPVNTSSTPGGNDVITGSQNLTSNLVAANVTIETGATLTTNGFSIIVSGTFDNQGAVVTGFAPAGPLPDSLGGSGGGAQSLNWCPYDQNGASTLAPGGSLSCSNSESGAPGASPVAPSLTGSLLSSWYASDIQDYLAGGAGGAIQGYIPAGAGAYGLYIQGETLIPGAIDAAGGAGQGSCSGVGLSGGGGGGTLVLAYGTGVYGTLDLNAAGGSGARSCDGTVASGGGGSGQLELVAYGSSPPVTVSSNPVGTHGPGSSAGTHGTHAPVVQTLILELLESPAFLVVLSAVAVGILLVTNGRLRAHRGGDGKTGK
jgi:hypothetical protein